LTSHKEANFGINAFVFGDDNSMVVVLPIKHDSKSISGLTDFLDLI
jgi:hypothetical protein